MKVFAIDLSVCNGCYCCQIACKDEHVANDWTPYAKPQPDTGQFWIGLTELVRGQVPKVKLTYIPRMCQHCDDAPCMAAVLRRDLQARRRPGDHRSRKVHRLQAVQGCLPARCDFLQ
jgi:Fe-S-cluster-containing dehydrogenase component